MRNFFSRIAAFVLSFVMVFTVCSYLSDVPDAHAAVFAVWPAEARFTTITTYFDPARNNSDAPSGHNAIDIAADGGSNIYAVYDGVVVSADWKGDYGYLSIVYHPDLGVYTFYAHASQLIASAGTSVNQGDVIAKVGNTGNSFGNHIHFGVCTDLLGGYPTRYYYDPLSYFVYSYVGENGNNNQGAEIPKDKPANNFTEEYAGLYTTKDVTTYLNIRAENNTSSEIVGKIPANAEFNVSMSDGEWAYMEYNGQRGFVSMTYIQIKEQAQQTEQTESRMSIDSYTSPKGELEPGQFFLVRGVITSDVPIKKVFGGVYFRNGEQTSQYVEAYPNTLEYDLSTYFDANLVFGVLKEGEYTYQISALDANGAVYHLVTSNFVIGKATEAVVGDVSGDGVLNNDDAIILQNYLLNRGVSFSREQYLLADLNGDGKVDVFDLIELKKAVLNAA